jgi:type IV pilus assembly protein PilV
MMRSPINSQRQSGASLLEVLVSILLLSFGMLALGAMMSFAVQMPKLAAYRATAAHLAASHVERVRANPGAFRVGGYSTPLNYDGTTNILTLSDCIYPNCTEASLAVMDVRATQKAVREQLPAGGIMATCSTSPCNTGSYGNLWIIWQEPTTYASLNPANSDNCPATVISTYTSPRPRCLYVRYKVD